jgi:hypothetical protein
VDGGLSKIRQESCLKVAKNASAKLKAVSEARLQLFHSQEKKDSQ